SCDRWLEQRWFRFLVAGWTLLEITALVLCIMHDSDRTNLPQILRNSIRLTLATLSICGVTNIQIIAITYPFAVPYVKREWWKWAVILECVEALAVTVCALCLQNRAPLELAYIVPFTSQTLAFIAILQASKGLPERPTKHLADYLLTTGIVFSLISLLVLGLSLARLLDRLLYVQCGLFILSLTIVLRPADSHGRPAIPAT
ncbi:unnamed protein product, partial [Clonostachys solani]